MTTQDVPNGKRSPSQIFAEIVARLGETGARDFFFSQPRSPDLPGPVYYLMNPPTPLSSTTRWIDWRRYMLVRALNCPEDPNFQVLFDHSDAVLAWRATVPLEFRFWKEG